MAIYPTASTEALSTIAPADGGAPLAVATGSSGVGQLSTSKAILFGFPLENGVDDAEDGGTTRAGILGAAMGF